MGGGDCLEYTCTSILFVYVQRSNRGLCEIHVDEAYLALIYFLIFHNPGMKLTHYVTDKYRVYSMLRLRIIIIICKHCVHTSKCRVNTCIIYLCSYSHIFSLSLSLSCAPFSAFLHSLFTVSYNFSLPLSLSVTSPCNSFSLSPVLSWFLPTHPPPNITTFTFKINIESYCEKFYD